MKWEEFLKIAGRLPVIDTNALLPGVTDVAALKVQISRWQKAGKIIQLKKGIYVLADSYRKVTINEFYIATVLKRPSYLSMEKALEYYNLIPERVTVYTSLTTKRGGRFISGIGDFEYRHIKKTLFWGYESVKWQGQTVFIATPEKALMDLVYENKIKVSLSYLEELRLQNTESVNLDKLVEYARRFKKPKMLSAALLIKEFLTSDKEGEKSL